MAHRGYTAPAGAEEALDLSALGGAFDDDKVGHFCCGVATQGCLVGIGSMPVNFWIGVGVLTL